MKNEHDDTNYCTACDATGESRHGEGKCLRCKGLGVIRPEPEHDDDKPRDYVWTPGRWRTRAA